MPEAEMKAHAVVASKFKYNDTRVLEAEYRLNNLQEVLICKENLTLIETLHYNPQHPQHAEFFKALKIFQDKIAKAGEEERSISLSEYLYKQKPKAIVALLKNSHIHIFELLKQKKDEAAHLLAIAHKKLLADPLTAEAFKTIYAVTDEVLVTNQDEKATKKLCRDFRISAIGKASNIILQGLLKFSIHPNVIKEYPHFASNHATMLQNVSVPAFTGLKKFK